MVAVDVGPDRPPLDVIVRFYVSETGKEYWRPSALIQDLAAVVEAVAVKTLIQREIDALGDNGVESSGGPD
jgi:hypothetical protein